MVVGIAIEHRKAKVPEDDVVVCGEVNIYEDVCSEKACSLR